MTKISVRLLLPTLLIALVTRGVAAERPNLVFILSDDIAQGDLGCYGQKLIQTPHLDRMAAEGTRYLQAYSGTTVCAPARTSLMTGLHMGHSPVRANREIRPEGQMPLPEKTATVEIPISRQVRITRRAISPRLATRTFSMPRVISMPVDPE